MLNPLARCCLVKGLGSCYWCECGACCVWRSPPVTTGAQGCPSMQVGFAISSSGPPLRAAELPRNASSASVSEYSPVDSLGCPTLLRLSNLPLLSDDSIHHR